MYEEILLPVDDSSATSAVVRHAAELANWADATLQVLHVADTNRDSVTVVDSDVVDALEREGRSIVEETGEVLGGLGVGYRTDVVQGDPAETIVDYADRYGMDLVVMPTRGREGVSKYLLGSVSEKVLRLSSVPVLTTRMADDERLDFPYERLLVPVDGSETAALAADHALALAAALGAAVQVVSVVEGGLLGADAEDSPAVESSREAARQAVEEAVERADEQDLTEVVGEVLEGEPDEAIREAIDAAGADAVVMGTTGRRGVEDILLGSVAERTVRSAPVPVITVRKP